MFLSREDKGQGDKLYAPCSSELGAGVLPQALAVDLTPTVRRRISQCTTTLIFQPVKPGTCTEEQILQA